MPTAKCKRSGIIECQPKLLYFAKESLAAAADRQATIIAVRSYHYLEYNLGMLWQWTRVVVVQNDQNVRTLYSQTSVLAAKWARLTKRERHDELSSVFLLLPPSFI